MRKVIGWSILLCSCVLVFVGAAAAQGVGSSGNMGGVVTDSSGALLPNVKVTIADPQTGLQRSVTTDASGRFQAIALPPATYNVTVQHEGFQTELRRGVGSWRRGDRSFRISR